MARSTGRAPGRKIERLVRALVSPFPGAFTFYEGRPPHDLARRSKWLIPLVLKVESRGELLPFHVRRGQSTSSAAKEPCDFLGCNVTAGNLSTPHESSLRSEARWDCGPRIFWLDENATRATDRGPIVAGI